MFQTLKQNVNVGFFMIIKTNQTEYFISYRNFKNWFILWNSRHRICWSYLKFVRDQSILL